MAKIGDARYYTVDELERALGENNIPQYVRNCEAGFMKQTAEIAYQTAWSPDIKAIFIAGPTSSGKTTFSHRLSSALNMHGRPTCTLSLDDYYLDCLQPRWVDERPDLESLDTLDVPLMLEQISALLRGKTVQVPTFDFQTRRRVELPQHTLRVPPRGILLVEGLHGLSKEVSGALPHKDYLSVLIMPYATLVGDAQLLNSRDIRILRRLCRDSHQRGTHALATLDYWPMLDYAEGLTMPEYSANADIFVNSVLGYELCVIPAMAKALLGEDIRLFEDGGLREPRMVKAGQKYVDIPAALRLARRLMAAADQLPQMQPEVVPENSILNEFIR